MKLDLVESDDIVRTFAYFGLTDRQDSLELSVIVDVRYLETQLSADLPIVFARPCVAPPFEVPPQPQNAMIIDRITRTPPSAAAAGPPLPAVVHVRDGHPLRAIEF